jgi:small subunit ribosomal protein S18
MVEKRYKKFNGKGKTVTLSKTLQNTIDYKNVLLLRKFITIEGKILPRRLSSLTAKQHRAIAKAIKNARMIGLLPFVNKDS